MDKSTCPLCGIVWTSITVAEACLERHDGRELLAALETEDLGEDDDNAGVTDYPLAVAWVASEVSGLQGAMVLNGDAIQEGLF
jgi:hypothetical protein